MLPENEDNTIEDFEVRLKRFQPSETKLDLSVIDDHTQRALQPEKQAVGDRRPMLATAGASWCVGLACGLLIAMLGMPSQRPAEATNVQAADAGQEISQTEVDPADVPSTVLPYNSQSSSSGESMLAAAAGLPGIDPALYELQLYSLTSPRNDRIRQGLMAALGNDQISTDVVSGTPRVSSSAASPLQIDAPRPTSLGDLRREFEL